MAYVSTGLIQAADYNGFVNLTAGANVNATWSTGTTSAGYGQTTISSVSASGVVTAVNWASLVNTIASMAAHQGTAITARTAPVTGNTVSILSALNTDITNCYNNRGNAVANGTQFTGWTGTNSLTGGRGAGAWSI
jgi:hypothetical protein